MAEIDKEWTKKRNEILIDNQDEACDWGKSMLAHSRKPDELFSCQSFLHHIKNRRCQQCAELLKNAGEKARNAMLY